MKKRMVLILAAVLMLGCAGGCGKKTEIVKDTEFMEAIANDTERGGNQKKADTEETEEQEDTAESEKRTLMYATDSLNVRSGAGTDFEAIGKLAKGDSVMVVGSADANGWVQVHTGLGEGYCKLEYLSTENPAEETVSSDVSATGTADSTGASTSERTTDSSTGSTGSTDSTTGTDSSASQSSSSSDSDYSQVTYSGDYSLLPDNEYDRIDIDYCERHNMIFSVSSSGKITWYHDAESCTADADDPFDMNNIYK